MDTFFMVGAKRYIEYVVKQGDGLMAIARDHLGTDIRWGEIIKKNENDGHPALKVDPHTIFPGQVLGYPDDTYHVPGFDGVLTVTATEPLSIHDMASYNSNSISTATKGMTFHYKTNSVSRDELNKRTYVEVSLQGGTSTGWLPVRGPSNWKVLTSSQEDWVTPSISGSGFVPAQVPPHLPVPPLPTPVPPVAATKYCFHCGTKITADAIYCSSCGTKQP
jgi:hypothetical protein